MIDKPLRSVLYMPASNQRAMDKARGLMADAIVFDLEDAVAPGSKASARAALIAQLALGGYGQRQLAARCNSLASPWGRDDVTAVAQSAELAVICLPKVESAAELDQVAAILAEAGRKDIALWAMLETPAGIVRALEIAQHPAVKALVMGTTDLASELRVPHRPDRLGLQWSLSQAVLAARMANIVVLDGVYLELDNPAGFEVHCEQGRALGFDGKTLIHPSQLAVANRVFGPSEEEQRWAERVISAWQAAEQQGLGLAVLDGKLVETMHVDEARRTLATARYIAEQSL